MTHYDIRSLLAKFLFWRRPFKTIKWNRRWGTGRIAAKTDARETNLLYGRATITRYRLEEVLEEALLRYTEKRLFIISHDRYFLNKVVDKLLVLTIRRETYLGNYDYYLQKIDEIEEEEEQSATVTQHSSSKKPALKIKP